MRYSAGKDTAEAAEMIRISKFLLNKRDEEVDV